MIIDSHCHLDYPVLYNELDNVIDRAEKNNVKIFLTISTNLKSFDKIKLIVDKYENVYGTLGIHPHETKDFINIDSTFLKKLYNENKKIIGIGETGLDYYYDNSEREVQKKIFEEHLKTSSLLNLPTIVHTRNAEHDTYELIKEYKQNSNIKILIHCFTGTKEFAKKLLDLDCYISLSGIITFKKSIELVEAVSYIPIDKLLIETDSPYLAPEPFRGKSNEPSYLRHVASKLSEIKKISIDDIEKNTSNNFLELFNLK